MIEYLKAIHLSLMLISEVQIISDCSLQVWIPYVTYYANNYWVKLLGWPIQLSFLNGICCQYF